MGTRSVIARDNDHRAKGRYVHWNGYPTGVGRAIMTIVNRDGLEAARKRLTEDFFGWSAVNGEGADLAETTTDDGRFVTVPGYGTAYSHAEHEDGWAQPIDSEEYGYVLLDDALEIWDGHAETTTLHPWGTDPALITG